MNEKMNDAEELAFHHVGIVVESISDAAAHYSVLFGPDSLSEVYHVTSQKVNVCFVKVSAESYLELVEPSAPDSVVAGLLKNRVGYYHAGYKVRDIRNMVEKLEALGYKALEYFHSEAFGGKLCIFLYTPDAHLMELIEE